MNKRFTAGLLALILGLLSACGNNDTQTGSTGQTQPAETAAAVTEDPRLATVNATDHSVPGAFEVRDMTTQEIVDDMGLGINLGNTFEATAGGGSVQSYETSWGSTIITKEIIDGYYASGFGVLRVPVAWSNMMSEDYTIAPEYLARVNEIVGWAVDSGIYVILNIHWDGGWWEKFPTEKEECMKKYTRIWEQLSEYYGGYGDKLMFESLNEEGGWDSIWNRYSGTSGADKEESYGLLNEINQKFVDIVRGSGGNNAGRHLLIAGYGTDISLTCDELYKMPDDPAGRCAVSVHYYTPSTFAILEKDADWGKAKTTWGTQADVDELNKYMDMMKETFVDKGVPVIIGEYSCAAKKNKELYVARRYNLCVCQAAYSRKMCPVLWDVMNEYYNRYIYKMNDPLLKDGFDRIKAGDGEKVFEEQLAYTGDNEPEFNEFGFAA